MNRRTLLTASSSGILLGIGGCIDISQGPRTSEDPTESREFPDRPDELDTESVLEYVKRYEEAFLFDRHSDEANVSPYCDPDVAVEYEEGFYVGMESCRVDISYEEEPAQGHFPTPRVLYLVTESETYRVKPDTRQANTSPPTDRTDLHETSVLLANFDPTEHVLSVQFSHEASDGESVPILDEAYRLASENRTSSAPRGVYLTDVIAPFGEADEDWHYELRAELEDGAETNETFRLTRYPPEVELLRAISITPSAEIVVREIEFSD